MQGLMCEYMSAVSFFSLIYDVSLFCFSYLFLPVVNFGLNLSVIVVVLFLGLLAALQLFWRRTRNDRKE